MYSHSDIEDAVEGGALTAEQAASLRNFVARRTGTPTADEEHVRMLQGFNDIYVYVSSILLIIGLGWLASKVEISRGPSFFVPLVIALACWGLAEYFVKRKRLALTAITLTWVFAYSIFFTIMLLAAEVIGPGGDPSTAKLVTAVSSAIAGGAAFLHWKRFAEPIAISLIAWSAAAVVMSLLSLAVPSDPEGTVTFLIMTLLGLATLAYAQIWEAKDIHRTTKKADIGFWLHTTAASETIIGLAGLLGLFQGHVSQGAAIGTIVLFVVALLVGLVLDRRLWVLLSAWPLGVGLYTLIRGDAGGGYPPYGGYSDFGGPYGNPYGGYQPYGMGIGDTVDNAMLAVLIVGVILILVGMFWTQLRGLLGGLAGPLAGKVPPVRRQDNEGQAFE